MLRCPSCGDLLEDADSLRHHEQRTHPCAGEDEPKAWAPPEWPHVPVDHTNPDEAFDAWLDATRPPAAPSPPGPAEDAWTPWLAPPRGEHDTMTSGPPSGGPSPRLGIAIATSVGVVMLAVVVLAVVVGVRRVRHAAAGPDAAALAGLTAPLPDLSPDFKRSGGPERIAAPQDSGVCHSPARDGPHSTWITEWNYLSMGGGRAYGDLSVQATAVSSPDVIGRERAYFASAEYRSCLEQTAVHNFAIRLESGSGSGPVRTDARATDTTGSTQSGFDDTFRVAIAFQTSRGNGQYTSLVGHLFAGRFMIRVTLDFCNCGSPPDAATLARIADELRPRLAKVASK